MQDGDRPGAAGEQLLGMLAAGAGPFPYRSGVHRLLGIPPRGDGEVRPPRALLPVDLPYETRAAFDPAITAGPDATGLLSSPPPIPIRGARPLASKPPSPVEPATAPRRDPSPAPAADPAPSPTAAAQAPVVAEEPVLRAEAPAKTIGLSIPGITSREAIPVPRSVRDGEAQPAAGAAPSPSSTTAGRAFMTPPAASTPESPRPASAAPRVLSRRETVAEVAEEPPPAAPRMASQRAGVEEVTEEPARLSSDAAATMERATRPALDDPPPATSAPRSTLERLRPTSAAPQIVSRRGVGEVAEEPARLRARASSDAAAPVEALRAATVERAARRAADDPPAAARAPESPRPAPAAPPQPRVIVVREAEPASATPRSFWSSSTLRGIHLRVLR